MERDLNTHDLHAANRQTSQSSVSASPALTVLFGTFIAALEGELKLEWLGVDVILGRLIVALRHAARRSCDVLRHPDACFGSPGEILLLCSA